MLAVDVQSPAFVPVVLVTFIVSPLTPDVADAVGAWAEPLYVNVVVLPQVTATLLGFILNAFVVPVSVQFSFLAWPPVTLLMLAVDV